MESECGISQPGEERGGEADWYCIIDGDDAFAVVDAVCSAHQLYDVPRSTRCGCLYHNVDDSISRRTYSRAHTHTHRDRLAGGLIDGG